MLNTKAQSAVEYLLLLAVVAIIVFVGFNTMIPRAGTASNVYFKKVTTNIMGNPPKFCGDGYCDDSEESDRNCSEDCP